MPGVSRRATRTVASEGAVGSARPGDPGRCVVRVADPTSFSTRLAQSAASMAAHELDNPFWSSLQTRHRHIAQQAGNVARYPREFAPFLGAASAEVDIAEAIESLVAPDESVYLLGVLPEVPAGW